MLKALVILVAMTGLIALSGCIPAAVDSYNAAETPPKQIGPDTWVVQGYPLEPNEGMSSMVERRVVREHLCKDDSFQVLSVRQLSDHYVFAHATTAEGTIKCVPAS